ncbi:MAG TPA: hypothetical protein VN042_13820 [Asticcacaulis sp.]|nr:hypothetical protein [Asticcacaulis sp.]
MRYGFDAPPAAPSDFPSDPVVHHHLLAWLLLVLFAVVATASLTLVFKSAEKMMRSRLGDGVDARVKLVRKSLEAAARARADDQLDLAQAARTALNDNFGRTLALSDGLSKAVDALNKALEGVREEEVKPQAAAGGGVVHGDTVINIAVANGAVAPVPMAASEPHSAPALAEPAPVKPEDRRDALWRAVQKLFAYWSNMNVVGAAFRAAQTQLLQSPAWIAPHEIAPPPEAPPRFWPFSAPISAPVRK